MESEINFFYGGTKNKLWHNIGKCYKLELDTIVKIKDALTTKGIGVGDIISSCRRNGGSALDRDLKEIEWNTALFDKVKNLQILFTSKIVKTWFKENIGPLDGFEYVVLISPSPAALIWLASTDECKEWLKNNPGMKVSDFRLKKYKEIFF